MGRPTSLDDYERKAQAMTYDGQRAMFEAYGRNKYTSTGVIQWMLEQCVAIADLASLRLLLGAGRRILRDEEVEELVHVQYSYDDNSVAVVNGRYEEIKGVKVCGEDLQHRCEGKRFARCDDRFGRPTAQRRRSICRKWTDLSKTYFLKLELHDAARETA